MATTLILTLVWMLIQALLTTFTTAIFFILVIIKQNKISEEDHRKRAEEARRLKEIREKAAKEADERIKEHLEKDPWGVAIKEGLKAAEQS